MNQNELVLPTQRNEVKTHSPKVLIIFSAPKTGKTELTAGLDDNLLVDLEDGSDHVSAMSVKVNTYQELHQLCEKVKASGKPYRYGTLDTITALEDMCLPLALALYNKTPMGAAYKGDILSLPNGAGYLYLRNAFQIMIDKFKECFERVILLGHVKDKAIERQGKEVVARELALTGKLSSITCAHADAIGFLYREENKCILTFETNNELICGARPHHLRNQKIVVSEQDAQGKTTTYWGRIFID